MKFHPDRNPDNKEAEEKFNEAKEAYGILTDGIPLLYGLNFACFSDKIDDVVSFGLYNNLRITNQEGVFTWNSHPYLPLEHGHSK